MPKVRMESGQAVELGIWEHRASGGTLTGALFTGYWYEEMLSHHRGRIADHGQGQDEEALRFPASFPGRNMWASFLGTRD